MQVDSEIIYILLRDNKKPADDRYEFCSLKAEVNGYLTEIRINSPWQTSQ